MRPMQMLIVCCSCGVFSGCFFVSQEERIATKLDAANYCSSDADCSLLDGKCPFGCRVLINGEMCSRVGELLEGDFPGACILGEDCSERYHFACRAGRCEFTE